jgi:hypothetical protein
MIQPQPFTGYAEGRSARSHAGHLTALHQRQLEVQTGEFEAGSALSTWLKEGSMCGLADEVH